MGCIPSSTYFEPNSRHAGTPGRPTTTNVHSGSDFVVTRHVSTAQISSGPQQSNTRNSPRCRTPGGSPVLLSPHRSLYVSAPPQLRSQRDVSADTAYTTCNGAKYRFLYGRPVGFAGAEEVISCLDDAGMQGNLYRLVRSKLVSIGEEEEGGGGVDGAGQRHADTLLEAEAIQREQGMELLACSVTARRRRSGDSRASALQEQYVVALLGTDTILDPSAIAPSRRRLRSAAVQVTEAAEQKPNAARLSAAVPPPPPGQPSFFSSSESKEREVGRGAHGGNLLNFNLEDTDYQFFPQAHYSALPAQRKAGGSMPVALCPPSRTLRMPVRFSAVEDRVMASSGKAGDSGKSWKDRVMQQRMFRLATSETRTWAFYNDSEYIMHVYTLFDRSSKLESRDSTRLWPSSVFDDGNEAPTPPPVFFGLFFDQDGEEAVPASEMPDSAAHRPRRMFGTRGMWIAELLVPPRSTRLFVEGKIRGAYRMRCTRLDLDDLVAATGTALSVAQQRNARHASTDRFRFSLLRPSLAFSTPKVAAAPSNPRLETSTTTTTPDAAAAATAGHAESNGAAAALRELNPTGLSHLPPPPPRLPLVEATLTSAENVAQTPHQRRMTASLIEASCGRNRAGLPSAPEIGCHSIVTESQGVLKKLTYISHNAGRTAADALHVPESRPVAPARAGVPANSSAGSQSTTPPDSPEKAGATSSPIFLSATPTAVPSAVVGLGPHPLSVAATANALPQRDTNGVAADKESAACAAPAGDLPNNVLQTVLQGHDDEVEERSRHDGPLDTSKAADNERREESSGRARTPHISPPLFSLVSRSVDDRSDTADGGHSTCDTQSSCAGFARIRPNRQRVARTGGDVLSSISATSIGQESTGDDTRILRTRCTDPNTEAPPPPPLFVRAATRTSVSDGTTSAAVSPEDGLERTAPMHTSRTEPHALAASSPCTFSKDVSNFPRIGGTATPVGGEDKCLSAESSGALNGTPWRPVVHTLTPPSSYQSGRASRIWMPDTSSFSSVNADDSPDPLGAEGGVQVQDSTSAANVRTILLPSVAAPAGHATEL